MKIKWELQYSKYTDLFLNYEDFDTMLISGYWCLKNHLINYKNLLDIDEYNLLNNLVESRDKDNLIIAYIILTNKEEI